MENSLTVIKEQKVLEKDFRVYGTFESPLFLARDVAEWIDYNLDKVNQMLAMVDAEEKLTAKIYRSGQNRDMWFLTEDGLYEVLMQSTKPIAKQFKKEVKKILHEIRTKGSYTVPKTFAEALRLAAEQQERIEAQTKQIQVLTPKAEVHDRIANSEGLKSVEEVAKNLGYGKNIFFSLLRGLDIFYYANTPQGKVNLPKQTYLDSGYFKTVEEPYQRGDKSLVYTKIYVTGKGETWLAKKVAA